ncbi:amidohydrolase [Amylibacter sp.]|nr:amidohydrolase [Amylibacter sp.]MDC0982629.1 amidohydrolase [Amylibacter sp.]
MLTSHDLIQLTKFRRELHQYPELSGKEIKTAQKILHALKDMKPSKIIDKMGGHGLAAIFDSQEKGPTLLFRAELDALPIQEKNNLSWISKLPGVSHTCGHDGHMTMLLALGRVISRKPIKYGKVVLMFQPSEENGQGARAIVSDPRYEQIKPDLAFAIHIEPGRPFGYVSTSPGLMNCASLGLKITLHGKTAHAADPDDGISPSHAVAEFIQKINKFNHGNELSKNFSLATVTYVQIGEQSFGISPGEATIFVTLRTSNDDSLNQLNKDVRILISNISIHFKLNLDFEIFDHFAASINHEEAYDIAVNAMKTLNINYGSIGVPMRASEDFGIFGMQSKAAMLCLGPGKNYAALHKPDYDFNDDLIPIGTSIFERITRDLLGTY